jgi:hypothetical protein
MSVAKTRREELQDCEGVFHHRFDGEGHLIRDMILIVTPLSIIYVSNPTTLQAGVAIMFEEKESDYCSWEIKLLPT